MKITLKVISNYVVLVSSMLTHVGNNRFEKKKETGRRVYRSISRGIKDIERKLY